MTDNAELIARARTAAKNLRMWVATDCRIGAIRLEELVVALEAAGLQESAPFPGECGEPAGLLARIAAQQARIDALMLEYCPEEMTPEQMAEWQRNQKDIGEKA